MKLLAIALAATIGGFAIVIGTATLTSSPLLFLLAGGVVFLTITALGVVGLTRHIPADRRRRTRGAWFGITAGASLALLGLAILLPTRDPRLPPAAVPGQQFWDLSTGSRIAYVRIPAEETPNPTPIIFLHGGPGVADMAGDAAYFGQLARGGYDVYVYDQVGTGRSSRLDDPRQYSIARNVADLEEIRQQVGAERVVLIGHSWGGMIAAGYLAEHGDHVAKVVFSSPGPLPGTGDTSDELLLGRLDLRKRLGVYALLVRPRMLLAYGLLQVNPQAAHAFAGDAEMDARNDRVYNRSRAAAHCDGADPGPELHGLGFYAFQYPQSAASTEPADPRPGMAGQTAPALIIKGSCDYLSWSSALDYRDALPGARLVYLEAAGHNAYQDQPNQFLSVVRAFLAGQDLPIAPWTDSAAPASYEGPVR